MKRNFLSALSCILLLSFSAHSQIREFGSVSSSGGQGGGSNFIKLNFAPLAYSTISLNFERIIGSKTTFGTGLTFRPKSALPFSSTFKSASTEDFSLGDIKLSTIGLFPELRYYTKEAGKGFYLGLYTGVRNVGIVFPVSYVDNASVRQSVDLKGNVLTFMGGFMMGAQFKLSSRLVLDWTFLAGHGSYSQTKFSYSSTYPMTTSEQADLKLTFDGLKEIGEFFPPFRNVKYDVGANSGWVKLTGLGFGARGGFSLGYRF